jgi:voltage-gated potassium channel
MTESKEFSFREKCYEVIFGTQTKAGKRFDLILLCVIVASILVVFLDSIQELHQEYYVLFLSLEWFFTIIFTIEYVFRIWSSPRPMRYIFSFWGMVDLLSIIPTYLSIVLSGYQYLLVVRSFRLLRVFRILKMIRFTREANMLFSALKASSYKVSIFFFSVITIVILLGTLMYVIEGEENGFTSIPTSIYWAIVTLTTVGYGDLVPLTVAGKILSSFAMIIGYSIIAVPTGIVTAELSRKSREISKRCKHCNGISAMDAKFCESCGTKYEG